MPGFPTGILCVAIIEDTCSTNTTSKFHRLLPICKCILVSHIHCIQGFIVWECDVWGDCEPSAIYDIKCDK